MLTVIIIFWTFVTFSHALTLVWTQHHQTADIAIRRKVWHWHLVLNGGLWFILIVAIIAAQIYFFNQISSLFIFGILVMGIGLWLVIASHIKLGGLAMAMGKKFFFPEQAIRWQESGVYKYLRNPVYDGFLLLIIGAGIAFGGIENYYLAAASFVLLNLFLAYIESRGASWGIF